MLLLILFKADLKLYTIICVMLLQTAFNPIWSIFSQYLMIVKSFGLYCYNPKFLDRQIWANSAEQSDLNLNSLLVKRQIDNPSPGAVTGGN